MSRLKRLDADLRRRRELVGAYRELLADVDGVSVAYAGYDLEQTSGYLMAVLLDRPETRYELRVALREEHGIQTTVFPAIHRLTTYRELVGEAPLPAAEHAADAHMVLPLFPHMTAAEQKRVVGSLRAALAATA